MNTKKYTMARTAATLSPCPFCGGGAMVNQSNYNGKWYVVCCVEEEHNIGHFNGEGFFETAQKAKSAWNMRVAP